MDAVSTGSEATAASVPLSGGFVLDLRTLALRDAAGRAIELRPQAFDVLRVLASRAGQVVTKDELLAAVWPGLVVTDDSLVQAVGDIRRALGPAGHRLVKTVPRRGYLLAADAVNPPTPAGMPASSSGRILSRSATQWVKGLLVAAAAVLGIVVWQAPWRADGAAATRTPSIAVLPFKAPAPDGEALARDIAVNLVSELARSPDLRVVSTQSSFPVAEKHRLLPEISRALRSRYLVDGTVRRERDSLSLVVDLIDSLDGRVVWSSAHDVGRDNLADAQRALAARIAGSLQVRMRVREERRALEQPPSSLDVMGLTAQGRMLLRQYDAQGVREARRLFERALEIDPQYAQAWASLAQVNNIDIGLRLTGEWSRSRSPEVVAQVQRAIALQPDLPIAYSVLSEAEGVAGNFDASLAAGEKCVHLSPNDALCVYVLGAARLRMGDVAVALTHLGHARDLNPVAPAYLPAFHATALWAARRFDDALRATDECLMLAPNFGRCRVDRISTLVELGRLDEARAEAAQLQQRAGRLTAAQFAFGFADSASALRARRIAAAEAAGVSEKGR
jgi:DNA-binding winged helix-turn-helix (wHTH) protein/TolB-like protein